MLLIKSTAKGLRQVVFLNTFAILATISTADAFHLRHGLTPKFFICPQGMTLIATLVTTKHDLNLCGKDNSTATFLAVRIRHTHKVVTIPIIRSKQHVYLAKSRKGIYYNLNTQTNLLTITAKNGHVYQEKVIATDEKSRTHIQQVI